MLAIQLMKGTPIHIFIACKFKLMWHFLTHYFKCIELLSSLEIRVVYTTLNYLFRVTSGMTFFQKKM